MKELFLLLTIKMQKQTCRSTFFKGYCAVKTCKMLSCSDHGRRIIQCTRLPKSQIGTNHLKMCHYPISLGTPNKEQNYCKSSHVKKKPVYVICEQQSQRIRTV